MPTEKGIDWCNDSALFFQKEDASRIQTLHREIVDNILLSNDIEILDYGSGDGKIFELFPSVSDFKITLHDPEPIAINEAMRKFNGYANFKFESDGTNLPSNTFDAVIFCNVIMCIPTQEELVRTIQDLKRTVKENGIIYAGLTHPCFLDKKFATYTNSFTEGEQLFDYFKNGENYQVYMQEGQSKIVIKDFFWSLSFILNLFLNAGFRLLSMKEFRDVEKNNFSPFILLKFN